MCGINLPAEQIFCRCGVLVFTTAAPLQDKFDNYHLLVFSSAWLTLSLTLLTQILLFESKAPSFLTPNSCEYKIIWLLFAHRFEEKNLNLIRHSNFTFHKRPFWYQNVIMSDIIYNWKVYSKQSVLVIFWYKLFLKHVLSHKKIYFCCC